MYFTCDDCPLSYRSAERAKAHKDETNHAITVHVNPEWDSPRIPEFKAETAKTNPNPVIRNSCGPCGGTGVGYAQQQVGSGDWKQWITYRQTCSYCGGSGVER